MKPPLPKKDVQLVQGLIDRALAEKIKVIMKKENAGWTEVLETALSEFLVTYKLWHRRQKK